jgi:hypothetical protein
MNLKKAIRRASQNLVLRWRWAKTRQRDSTSAPGPQIGLDRCDVVYINLDHRKDRRAEMEEGFARIGLTSFKRLSATPHDIAILGCSMSHRDALLQKIDAPNRLLMICEDDCEFLVDRARLDHLIEAFFNDDRLDVLSLGYNAKNGVSVGKDFAITSNTQTMSCYVVRPHMQAPLLECMEDAITGLQNGLPQHVSANDVVWKRLQKTSLFAIPNDRPVQQRESYSDVQAVAVNYGV